MTPKERAAKAIEETMFAPHELPLPADLHAKYRQTTAAALAAIAEPSEAMIEAIKSAWKIPHASISDTGARVIWRAAHAAMMTEKDAGE